MEYQVFERDFITRTQTVIEQYTNYVPQDMQFEVTLLINCLLGLLVLPKERCLDMPELTIDELPDWGLKEEHIKNWGTVRHDQNPRSLSQIVRHLRNSVAHARVIANGDGSDITSVAFRDRDGFLAVLPVDSLRAFVVKFSQSVKM